MQRSNLILGAIRGYTFDQLSPFIRSLRAAGSTAELCLFHNSIDDASLAKLREHGATLIPFHKFGLKNPFTGHVYTGDGRLRTILNLYPRFIGGMPGLSDEARFAARAKFAKKFFIVHCSRYLMYLEYLLSRSAEEVGNVLIADLRDVFFQRDPFEFDCGDSLCVFNEHRSIRLETDSCNREWVEAPMGREAVDKFRSEPLSCSGVTLGSYPRMVEYLKAMAQLFFTSYLNFAYHPGFDQGAHNVLLWTGDLQKVRRFDNFDSPVLTMGGMKPDEVLLNDERRVINRDGSIVHIVHQHDRHPPVEAALHARLS
ncbi:MAG: hypothetical protein ABMA13_06615 [Chthoniobacteraceae bacterium]